jgi:hypothetical protein
VMPATLNDVGKKKAGEPSAEQQAAAELVRLAKEQGLSLTGPDGLLKQLTKTVLETALNEEITEHLGYDKHDPAGAGSGNIRNGTRAKTVLTEATGQVEIDVPRDRAGTFTPLIVRKRQRRLSGVDEVVLSLCAKGLTTGEISAHFAEIYGASVSKETISRITDKVIEEMNDWAVRPLEGVYAAVFIDAVAVKVRDGQVANRPFYAAIEVTLDGERDILGLWAGTGGEGLGRVKRGIEYREFVAAADECSPVVQHGGCVAAGRRGSALAVRCQAVTGVRRRRARGCRRVVRGQPGDPPIRTEHSWGEPAAAREPGAEERPVLVGFRQSEGPDQPDLLRPQTRRRQEPPGRPALPRPPPHRRPLCHDPRPPALPAPRTQAPTGRRQDRSGGLTGVIGTPLLSKAMGTWRSTVWARGGGRGSVDAGGLGK